MEPVRVEDGLEATTGSKTVERAGYFYRHLINKSMIARQLPNWLSSNISVLKQYFHFYSKGWGSSKALSDSPTLHMVLM